MILDAKHLSQETVIKCDVCVVGAGAAGITLAREFVDAPLKVCLLESGGLDFDDETQSLYNGDVVGWPHSDLETSRLRYFGGTTNHWVGQCRPLDADDFAYRPWIRTSGWPITRAQLDPFYARANEVVQIESVDWNYKTWMEQLPEFYGLPFIGQRLVPAIWQMSPPTRFGEIYRYELESADNVDTYLHANVVDIETDKAGNAVTRLRVACLNGNRFWVKAQIYVLATGGIENARLLLVSNTAQTSGLGNAFDMVGRFYMNHWFLRAGWIALSTPGNLTARPVSALSKTASRLTLTADTYRQERIAKFSADLFPAELDLSRKSDGYVALSRIFQRIRNAEIPDNLMRDVMRIISDLDGVAKDLRNKYGDTPAIVLGAECEQFPNPESRVTLGPEIDALGLKKVRLGWQLTDFDKFSLRRALEIVGEEVGRTGLGRLKLHDWLLSDEVITFPGRDSWHHMGTTRMSSDPKTGVVDQNCRVHGVHNLFIAGSSVFPTSGIANPTLTIVALALRLADHIKSQTKKEMHNIKLLRGGG